MTPRPARHQDPKKKREWWLKPHTHAGYTERIGLYAQDNQDYFFAAFLAAGFFAAAFLAAGFFAATFLAAGFFAATFLAAGFFAAAFLAAGFATFLAATFFTAFLAAGFFAAFFAAGFLVLAFFVAMASGDVCWVVLNNGLQRNYHIRLNFDKINFSHLRRQFYARKTAPSHLFCHGRFN